MFLQIFLYLFALATLGDQPLCPSFRLQQHWMQRKLWGTVLFAAWKLLWWPELEAFPPSLNPYSLFWLLLLLLLRQAELSKTLLFHVSNTVWSCPIPPHTFSGCLASAIVACSGQAGGWSLHMWGTFGLLKPFAVSSWKWAPWQDMQNWGGCGSKIRKPLMPRG